MKDFFEVGAGEHITDAENGEGRGGTSDIFDAGSKDARKFNVE